MAKTRKRLTGRRGAHGARGADGTRGEAGARGAHGARGEHAQRGEHGVRGTRGARGVEGSVGRRGKVGKTGSAGKTGSTGLAHEERVLEVVETQFHDVYQQLGIQMRRLGQLLQHVDELSSVVRRLTDRRPQHEWHLLAHAADRQKK